MPTVIELASSRRVSYNGGSPIGTRLFTVTGAATESDIYALFTLDGEPPSSLPDKFSAYPNLSGLVPAVRMVAMDFDLEKDPDVLQKWNVTVTYREVALGGNGPSPAPLTQLAPNDEGYLNVRGRTEGGFIEGWRLHDTAAEWNSAYASKTVNGLPIYQVGDDPNSDIGGRKIDVNGRPVSIETVREQITVDVTLSYIPNVELIRTYASTRNLTSFLGIPTGSVLFKGATWANIAPGKWSVSYEFAADNFSHLVQVAKENAGQPVLDARGQAKCVSWVQPFPRLAEHRELNQYLRAIP